MKNSYRSSEAGRLKKLAFVVSHSDAGGVQQLWSNLSQEFRARGWDTTLIALYPFEYLEKDASGLNFSYVSETKPKTAADVCRLLWSLTTTLRREKFDLVFTAMPAANIIVPVASALAAGNRAVVTSHHTPVITYNRILDRLDALLGRTALVTRTIAVSHSVSASLHRRNANYKRKCIVIHNALPRAVEDRIRLLRNRKRLGISPRPTVIATGRLAPQKNYPVLIRIAARSPGINFHVVGSGPDELMLKRMSADYGVEDRISFLGQRTREETLQLMADADIFFQPSYFEGHSLALIEAAKLGLPLVVSDVPVQLEGITARDGELCGVSANADDDLAFSAAFAAMLDNPSAYQAASDKSLKLGDEITFEDMIARYENIIVTPGV